MTIIYMILSMLILAAIAYTVLTRNLPKRKLVKHQAQVEASVYEPSPAEIRLLQEREYYQRRLANLSPNVYEKRSYGSVYRADWAERHNDEKSAIEQCIRDINHELMQLKGKRL